MHPPRYPTVYWLLVVSWLLIGSPRLNAFPVRYPPLTPPDSGLSWQQTDKSLALLNRGRVVWQLNYDATQDKPYFHPLRTPDGHDLTYERPADHPWHRGLWFSWKFINGVNYWEEDTKRGVSNGRSRITAVNVSRTNAFGATVTIELAYAPEGRAQALLTETRVLRISPPDRRGSYRIDWDMQFTAGDSALVLDRQVPLKHGGVDWGGYGGLGYRAAETLTHQRYLDANGWTNERNLTGYGETANWMDLSADATSPVATSPAGTPERAASPVGLAMFDHPRNPRHPSPWYVWFEAGRHAFFTPALLFDAPLPLRPRERLRLRYRVLIHTGRGNKEQLADEFNRFSRNP